MKAILSLICLVLVVGCAGHPHHGHAGDGPMNHENRACGGTCKDDNAAPKKDEAAGKKCDHGCGS